MSQDKEILFGERIRTLHFDIDAMIALEGAMNGKSTGDIVGELARWSFTTLVMALWAGLLHEGDKLTPAAVQKMLNRYVDQEGANLRKLRDDVRAAIQDSQWYRQAVSLPDDDEEAAPGGNA